MPTETAQRVRVVNRLKIDTSEEPLDVVGSTSVSTDNSSSTLVSNGGNFTGEWEDVTAYDSVVVSVSTDQDGYYEIQFSPDGTNTDSTLTRYYRTAQFNVPHRFTITRKYFRVRFFNDSGSDQTYLRLQTMYGSKADLNIPVDATMAQDYDAISVRPTDFTTESALGRRQGTTTWNKFGYNRDVDTASAEVVAEFGGTFQFLTAGETINIVSSSTDDIDTTGTGVRKLVIYGIDENWDEVIEVVNMNGTTTVTTSSSWIGINRATIFQSGSSDSNVGKITITASSSGYTMATMPATEGTTQQCILYVPRNHQFLATWLRLSGVKSSGGGSPSITFNGYVYSAVVDSQFLVFEEEIDTGVREVAEISPNEPFIVGEKSILWFTADTSANNTSVRGRFSGKLIRDADG